MFPLYYLFVSINVELTPLFYSKRTLAKVLIRVAITVSQLFVNIYLKGWEGGGDMALLG